MQTQTLEFWLDYGSTYTYLSVMRIEALAADHGIEVSWKPFFLYPILLEVGWREAPFTQMPAKGKYMWRDLERRAKLRGLPYSKPAVYPPNPLQTARVGFLAAQQGWCAEFSRKVFHGHFVDGCMIGDEQCLTQALGDLGRDPDGVLAAASTTRNKDALREQTEQAKSLGIFGSPSFIVDGELFWGDDRLDDAIAWCAHTL